MRNVKYLHAWPVDWFPVLEEAAKASLERHRLNRLNNISKPIEIIQPVETVALSFCEWCYRRDCDC